MSHVVLCIANVELLDLPDEILLMIIRQVKPLVELLSSFIGVGNARLDNLILDRSRCSSINLTFDFQCSPRRMVMDRFFSHVLPCIHHNIESLALNFKHLSYVSVIAFRTPERHFPNLSQLKIVRGRRVPGSGTPQTISDYSSVPRCVICIPHIVLVCFDDSELRRRPLFSFLPEIFADDETTQQQLRDFLRYSPVMESIVSFELENDWVLKLSPDKELLFPGSPHLTTVHVTLMYYTDCIHLLRQLGSQLLSFTVRLIYIRSHETAVVSQLTSVSLIRPSENFISMMIRLGLLSKFT